MIAIHISFNIVRIYRRDVETIFHKIIQKIAVRKTVNGLKWVKVMNCSVGLNKSGYIDTKEYVDKSILV